MKSTPRATPTEIRPACPPIGITVPKVSPQASEFAAARHPISQTMPPSQADLRLHTVVIVNPQEFPKFTGQRPVKSGASEPSGRARFAVQLLFGIFAPAQ